jgi:hypothetical protein
MKRKSKIMSEAVERLGAHYVACSGLLKVLDIVDGCQSACQLLSDIKDE